MEKSQNIQVEIVRIFRYSFSSLLEERPNLKQEDAHQQSRTCPSRVKKTPFLMLEEAFLYFVS